MILRKPYAFLIKHFRLIHLIILGCLLYLIYTLSNIAGFISTLIDSRVFTYAGADVFIDTHVYTFILIAAALSGIVYWLLTKKKKPTNLYLGLIVYSIVLIISFIYFYSNLETLVNSTLEIDKLGLLRDLLLLVRIPGYIFIVFCFIRGIGFNLKQFNFSKDIAELKIAEKDSEEFELMVGQNNYKYARFIRRTIRELSYYIRENLVAISIFGMVILAVLVILGIRYYNQYLKRLKAQEVTTINGITYVVNSSYITSEDYNGNIIKEGSKFVVIDMSFNNTTSEDKTLNYDRIRLVYKKLIYVPTLIYNSKFYDLGEPYEDGTLIPSSTMLNRYIVFEVPDTINTTDFTLRIEYGITNKDTKVLSNYIKFQVACINADTEDRTIDVNVGNPMDPNVLNINRFSLTVNKTNIQENYNDRYVICNKDLSCQAYNTLISANSMDNKTMMVLDIDGTMYADAKFTKTFNTYNKVFANYAYFTYIVNNRSYTEQAQVIPSEVEGKIFMLIDRSVLKATKETISLKFRNTTYDLHIK